MKEVEVKLLGKHNDWKFVVHTARVSGIPDDVPDEKVIEMIVKNDYSSCLEHIVFTFDISMTKLIAPEFLEHRVSSHTARSTRYTSNIESTWRMPEYFNLKNVSGDTKLFFEELNKQAFSGYQLLRKQGVPRDYARNVLPMTTMTRYIWTINARSLINFLGLRLCERAYLGIRVIAKQILEIVRREEPEIFKHVDCRGYNMGVCPENEARPKNCHHPEIPTKNEVIGRWMSSKL